MITQKEIDNLAADRELLLTRVVNAPRKLVFDVWTDPKHVAKWWGPNGFTNTIHEMNIRPGGVTRLTMHGPNGIDYPNEIIYKEIIKPERLVWTHGSGNKNEPGQFEVTVTFAELGQQTEITMHMVFRSKEERDMVVNTRGAIEGNRQMMNRLEEYLTKL